jgi:hypothetical protein
MKQREVMDEDNIKWTCVQAYAGLNGKVSGNIEQISESAEGLVPVACTPTGGAQSVRINLPKNWEEAISDEELLKAIKAG